MLFVSSLTLTPHGLRGAARDSMQRAWSLAVLGQHRWSGSAASPSRRGQNVCFAGRGGGSHLVLRAGGWRHRHASCSLLVISPGSEVHGGRRRVGARAAPPGRAPAAPFLPPGDTRGPPEPGRGSWDLRPGETQRRGQLPPPPPSPEP